MTPGEYSELVAVELKLSLPSVVSAHRALRHAGVMLNTGRGSSASHMSMEDGARVLACIAVKHTGQTFSESAAVVRGDLNLVSRLLMAMQGGYEFVHDFAVPQGDLKARATISGRALRCIGEQAGFLSPPVWTINERRAISGLPPIPA